MLNNKTKANKFLIIVAGPTAVGKTSVALSLAEFFNSDVFSADSRQIYKELTIGTAKPDLAELEKVRHHFINYLSITQNYSAGQYEKDIKKALDDYFTSNDIGIVTGGTGLYLRALMEGLDEFPEIPAEVSDKYIALMNEKGITGLQDELKTKDAEYYAQVDIYNARRLLRALNVIEVSGRKFSDFHAKKEKATFPCEIIGILLTLPRDILYDRINQRVDHMLEKGLESEARSVYVYKGNQALDTVGYKEMFQYIENITGIEDAVSMIKQNSRRYAKRQITWFGKYGNWKIFSPYDIEEIKKYIKIQLVE